MYMYFLASKNITACLLLFHFVDHIGAHEMSKICKKIRKNSLNSKKWVSNIGLCANLQKCVQFQISVFNKLYEGIRNAKWG